MVVDLSIMARVTALCCAIFAPVNIASAHAFWVVPIEGHAEPDERVVFDLRIGPNWPGEPTSRDTETLISRFELDDGMQKTPISGREGSRPVGHYTAEISGANYAVLTSYPHVLTLSGDEFETYLAEEGLKKAQQRRQKFGLESAPARERFRRNVKTLILVGGKSSGFDRQLGLPFELIPLSDPLQYAADEQFDIRLLRDGKPLADTQVTASLRDAEMVQRTRTDADGIARFKLSAGGVWMFYAVDIAPAATPDVDWDSIWTSLTFELDQ